MGPKTLKSLQLRFGIAEWYGKPFVALRLEELKRLAEIQSRRKSRRPAILCPFQSTSEREVECKKPGGTCSFQLYEKSPETGEVTLAGGEARQLRTLCPNRFEEAGIIYRWVGETVLKCTKPVVLKEIGFLESPPTDLEANAEESGENVSRGDSL